MSVRDYYTEKQEQEIRILIHLLIEADMEKETAIMTSVMMNTSEKRLQLIAFLEQNPNVSTAEIEREAIRIVKAEG